MSGKSNKLSKALKAGSSVKLLVGPKEARSQVYSVTKVNGNKVYLDGYRVYSRAAKITQQNTENFIKVPHAVHISNVKLES